MIMLHKGVSILKFDRFQANKIMSYGVISRGIDLQDIHYRWCIEDRPDWALKVQCLTMITYRTPIYQRLKYFQHGWTEEYLEACHVSK